jgi:hypothetical protein
MSAAATASAPVQPALNQWQCDDPVVTRTVSLQRAARVNHACLQQQPWLCWGHEVGARYDVLQQCLVSGRAVGRQEPCDPC